MQYVKQVNISDRTEAIAHSGEVHRAIHECVSKEGVVRERLGSPGETVCEPCFAARIASPAVAIPGPGSLPSVLCPSVRTFPRRPHRRALYGDIAKTLSTSRSSRNHCYLSGITNDSARRGAPPTQRGDTRARHHPQHIHHHGGLWRGSFGRGEPAPRPGLQHNRK